MRYGVTEDTSLTVDFHLYATSKSGAESVAAALEESGFEVRTRPSRILLVFKGFEVTASRTSTWSLIQLQEETRRVHATAEDAGVSLDGCGAALPEAGTMANGSVGED